MVSSLNLRATSGENHLCWMPGDLRPHPEEPAYLEQLIHRLNTERGFQLRNYLDLHKWSVECQSDFWDEMWRDMKIIGERGSQPAYTPHSIEQPQDWFLGARLNYAENILLGHPNALSSQRTALISCTEPLQVNDPVPVIGRYTWAELYRQVAVAVHVLRGLGVKPGDSVASFSSTNSEMVIAFLACSSLGAVYSSSPAEFGPVSVTDRFIQIKPKVVFSIDSTRYNGKDIDVFNSLERILDGVPGVEHVVLVGHRNLSREPRPLPSLHKSGTKYLTWQSFMRSGRDAPQEIPFWRGGFMHPLWVVFSSGTTGKPKAIVHPAGGMLLARKVIVQYHINLDHRDTCCQFTTMGWVMYNVSLGFLANGCTLITYDGSPFRPIGVMWDILQTHKATYYGTSPRYLQALDKAGYYPNERNDVSKLQVLAVTGAPVTPENYIFTDRRIKKGLYLFNASGGTEIASSFVSGVPTMPMYRIEIQVPTLGVATECLSDKGEYLRDTPGSLVATRAFPNLPIGFVNDLDRKRFLEAYFNDFPIPVFNQGDYIKISSNTGGIVMLGRSDGILNPGGVRFGSAEIYTIIEMFPNLIEESICVGQKIDNQDERVILFLKMRSGIQFTQAIKEELKKAIRANLSVRHVPAVITTCREIPVTTNGKKVGTYVKKLLNGTPLAKLDTNALMNPECLEDFVTNPDVRLPSQRVKVKL